MSTSPGDATFDHPFEDQRRNRRIFAGEQFLLEFRKKGQLTTYAKGHVNNLSQGGISFTSMTPLQEGALLEMVLFLNPRFPGSQTIELAAEVVRTDEGLGKFIRRIACRFQDLSPEVCETIRAFMIWTLAQREAGLAEDRIWKVSAPGQFFIEYKYNESVHKAYGCELSQTTASFTSLFAPPRGSSILLGIYYAPQFPGPAHSEIPAVILASHKVTAPNPFFAVKCHFEFKTISTQQTVQNFLKWLVSI